jgi:uncharacterized membrane protein
MRRFSLTKLDDWLYWIIFLSLIAGIILSIVSGVSLCTEACAESHTYRLFGLRFEWIGLFFFILAGIFHLLSASYPKLSFLTGLMIAGAFGSELKFILLQKNEIGKFCPVCLSIAACIAIAAAAFTIGYFIELNSVIRLGQRGELMKSITKGITSIAVVLFGFLVATVGIAKFDQLGAAEETVKESLAMGNLTSPIEVYVFTDWSCPACRAVEPEIEKMAPDVMKVARLTFVDYVIHPETLNYTPYNVSFMIKNKAQYFAIREKLGELSIKTGTPTDELVEKAVEPLGVKYYQLNYADITLSQKYFRQLSKQFGISKTPTVVVVNRQTKKGKKLVGGAEITEANVMKAIETLQK